MIKFFRATAGRPLDTITMEEAGVVKVRNIIDATSSDNNGDFPVAEIRGMTNGNVDIAVCNRASDGKIIHLVVPTEQRFIANF